jgi:hypothetical protein
MTTTHRLTAHQRRRLAVHACLDPRTVDRFLAGLPVRSTCLARLEHALAELRDLQDSAGLRPTEFDRDGDR